MIYSKFSLLFLFAYFRQSFTIQPINVNDCGKTKGCFFHPPECKGSVSSCTVAVTYALKNDKVQFEMAAKSRIQLDGQGQYIALGFSDDKTMGDDSVTSCIFNEDSSKNSVGLSYNKNGEHDNELVKVNDVVTLTDSGKLDSTVICRFEQKIQPNFKDSNKIRPLNKAYFLFLVTGSADLKSGQLTVHNTDHSNKWFPVVSSNKINVASAIYT